MGTLCRGSVELRVEVAGRVVRDGNTITGGGVTSGIDFALTVITETHDPATARRLQLVMEYDPAPPFDAGPPTSADADLDLQQLFALVGAIST